MISFDCRKNDFHEKVRFFWKDISLNFISGKLYFHNVITCDSIIKKIGTVL